MGETLSTPVTQKCTSEETAVTDGEQLRVGVSAMQGWRVSMEDDHSVALGLPPDLRQARDDCTGPPALSCCAVFDGHGGCWAAQSAAARLLTHLQAALQLGIARKRLAAAKLLQPRLAPPTGFDPVVVRQFALWVGPPPPPEFVRPPLPVELVPPPPPLSSAEGGSALHAETNPASPKTPSPRGGCGAEFAAERECLEQSELGAAVIGGLLQLDEWLYTAGQQRRQQQQQQTETGAGSLAAAAAASRPESPISVDRSGSTAVVCLLCSKWVLVANLGDSRAVLCRGPDAETVPLSEDQKPTHPAERTRIEAAGNRSLPDCAAGAGADGGDFCCWCWFLLVVVVVVVVIFAGGGVVGGGAAAARWWCLASSCSSIR